MKKGLSAFVKRHRAALVHGFKDGIPIGLGYFAVSFSLGIAARNAGLSPFQGFLASLLNNASAGEYAGFTLIEQNALYVELALITLITNLRYLLMSCALSQKLDPKMPFGHRFLIGFDVTDELFGIGIAHPGYIDPYYMYGAYAIALPCWAGGTALGVMAGNLLPERVVSALSVALFGMFLAIIIPPARKSKVVGAFVLLSFALSFAASKISLFSSLSPGTRTIILTVSVSAAAALLFPVKDEPTAEIEASKESEKTKEGEK